MSTELVSQSDEIELSPMEDRFYKAGFAFKEVSSLGALSVFPLSLGGTILEHQLTGGFGTLGLIGLGSGLGVYLGANLGSFFFKSRLRSLYAERTQHQLEGTSE